MTSSVEIVQACYADAVFVARRMREWDARECYACMWSPSPENLAVISVEGSQFAWTALKRGVPVAIFGAGEYEPTQYRMWLYATDDWPAVALRVSLFFRQVAMPTLLAAGANRAECFSIDGHEDAHEWLGVFGTSPEEARQEIARLRADDGFMKGYRDRMHPDHKTAQERMNRLYAISGNQSAGYGHPYVRFCLGSYLYCAPCDRENAG